MNAGLLRREFLARSIGVAVLSGASAPLNQAFASTAVKRRSGVNFKICLNAYSFNRHPHCREDDIGRRGRLLRDAQCRRS